MALKLPEDYFAGVIDRPVSALRALNYPHPTVPPQPGQLRAGAHTDYGSLTILLPEAKSGGLEIYTPEREWRPVPPVPGAFIINIGDLMALWTNDRWVSTLHRVVNPSPDAMGSTRRQSFAFFHQPNWDAEISCLESCLAPGEITALRAGAVRPVSDVEVQIDGEARGLTRFSLGIRLFDPPRAAAFLLDPPCSIFERLAGESCLHVADDLLPQPVVLVPAIAGYRVVDVDAVKRQNAFVELVEIGWAVGAEPRRIAFGVIADL